MRSKYTFDLANSVRVEIAQVPYWKHVTYRRKDEQELDRVFLQFSQICDAELDEVTRNCLRLPVFNNWCCEDWQFLQYLQFMFVDLGLTQKFRIEPEFLRNFLCTVYLNYNEVPFHNFRHAFCVTQMMYGMTYNCDLISRIGHLEVIILITSCICHDLDHPGFNNIYQINARTELALRYNDISPLENHHCSVAFKLLQRPQCDIFRNVSAETNKIIREGIIRCVLATDMARHNEILQDFRGIISEFDFGDMDHVNLLSMMLIKVADISNEARPLSIAEPWLECLMQEFFNQSDLEKLEGLPVSPFMDRDKVTKPSSQCAFIGIVLMPLFEAVGKVLWQLDELLIQPVRFALSHYQRLNELIKKNSLDHPSPNSEEQKSFCSQSSKTTCSTVGQIANDRQLSPGCSHDENGDETHTCGATNQSREESDEFAETEVEVSERTSRFKIQTEMPRSFMRRNSCEVPVSPELRPLRCPDADQRVAAIEMESTSSAATESPPKPNWFSRWKFFTKKFQFLRSNDNTETAVVNNKSGNTHFKGDFNGEKLPVEKKHLLQSLFKRHRTNKSTKDILSTAGNSTALNRDFLSLSRKCSFNDNNLKFDEHFRRNSDAGETVNPKPAGGNTGI